MDRDKLHPWRSVDVAGGHLVTFLLIKTIREASHWTAVFISVVDLVADTGSLL